MTTPAAYRYVGIPYLFGGRSEAGVDCAGLVLLYLRQEHGVALPMDDGLPIGPGWEAHAEQRFLAYLERHARQANPPSQDGDIVLIHRYRQAAHVGVMISTQRCLHVMTGRTAEITDIQKFGHRILGYWRVV